MFAQLILLFLIPFLCPSLCIHSEISVTGQQHSRQTCPNTFIIVTYHEAVIKALLKHLLASSRKQMGPFYLLLDLNSSVLDFYCELKTVFGNWISLHFHKEDRSILSIKEASKTSHYFRNTVLSTESRSQVETLSDLSSTVGAFRKSGASPYSVDILSSLCVYTMDSS